MHRIVSEPRSESPRESTLSLQIWVYEPVALVDIKRYSIDLLHAYSLLFSMCITFWSIIYEAQIPYRKAADNNKYSDVHVV